MSSLGQLTLARVRLFFREPSAVFWTFVFPILITIALGIAFRNRPPEPVAAAVQVGDGAPALATALARTGEVTPRLLPEADARAALRVGKVAVVIVPGSPRRYLFDPTRPESRLARLVVDDALQRAAGRVDPVPTRDVRLTAPGSRYSISSSPGSSG